MLLFLFVPDLDHLSLRVQHLERAELADPRADAKWFSVAWHDEQVRAAFVLSLKAGLLGDGGRAGARLGAAFGVHRFRFFGREAVSLLLVLPLALPGIITGIALNSFFNFNNVELSLTTIIIGHTTFCIVVVYNNVLARLRRVVRVV